MFLKTVTTAVSFKPDYFCDYSGTMNHFPLVESRNKYLLLQFVFWVGKGAIDATRTGAAQAQIATQADLVLGAVSVRCCDRALAQRWLTCTVNTDELHQSRHHKPCRLHCLPYLDPAAQAWLCTHNTTLKSTTAFTVHMIHYLSRHTTALRWGGVRENI